jgi:mono/diheme cytochrome c family protein
MLRRTPRWFLWSLLAVCGSACREQAFREPLKLGGKLVPAATLNRGKEGYTLYCRACHGDNGDGTGPAAAGYRPPPRDFTSGLFKFAAVASGGLPRDDDLRRSVRYGLHGTAMLAWDVDDSDLDAILQYLKTFSPRWKDEEPGEAIVPSADPWGPEHASEAIARGSKVYHAVAQCSSCHPAYETRQSIDQASRELNGGRAASFRSDLYAAEAKDSDYLDKYSPAPDGGWVRLKLLAPDFLFNQLRSVRDLGDQASASADLYRVIAAGIGGTAMPQWQGALPEADLWALVYYVRSLALLRDTPGAAHLRERLVSQPR